MDNTPDNPVMDEESFDEAVNKALKATQDAAAESDQESEAESGTLPEESATTQEVDAAFAAQADQEDTDQAAAPSADEPQEADADAEYKARLRKFTRELKKQEGQWYIIQCYSGYENKVKTNLDMRAQTLEVEDSIFEVVVPVEQVTEIKDGKRKLVKRKLLPGYVLVRMEINDRAWSVVRETPGVTSFVGNEGNATPVKHRDVAKFLMPQESGENSGKPDAEGDQVVARPEENAAPQAQMDFEVGESVTILTGALASVSATISSIDPATGKIQALVSIFGRETPVELTADQIEKIM